MRTGLLLACALLSACSDDEIDSDEAARRAYLGLDASIEKSIALGFQGFNAASSANIDPQMTTGTAPDGTGTLTISGQVDQGASNNKGMRLYVAMVDYSDGPFVIDEDGNTIVVTYDTAAEQANQPFLSMMLKNIPTGTIDGTLMGKYLLSGDDLSGEVTLNLTFNGMMQGTSQQDVTRVPGSTTVTGTATNADGGVYNVNVTL
jgi:hypothetical protein